MSLIKLKVDDNIPDIGTEGYKINISNNDVLVEANTNAGAFYALQSLTQLLATNQDPRTKKSLIPTGNIIDYPRFEYRGFSLDVARYFLDVKEVKSIIDVLALYKVSYLHLHLTDDQGWRIEIDSWPNLTTIGSKTGVGGNGGGFYTKADYQEIIDYAGQKFITIVPEIDMPGHSGAALSSYAELNCKGKASPMNTRIIDLRYLCVEDADVDRFVKDVIREIAEMTPGPYIHIGADEVWLLSKKKYKIFVDKVQLEIEANGKKMIAWNESVHSTLTADDIIQYWISGKTAEAVEVGAKFIMSPQNKAYLDHLYKLNEPGANWIFKATLRATDLKESYIWDPANYIDGVNEENILGVEPCSWGESLNSIEEYEHKIYPRLFALSEVSWSMQHNKEWSSFRNRLNKHQLMLDAYNINYYRSKHLDW